MKIPSTHGTGSYKPSDLNELGADCVLEAGVLIFHPERVILGDRVYVGHNAILKAYHKNYLRIGTGSWIGQQCFLHSAGGVTIDQHVGIGPGTRILSSTHRDPGRDLPIMQGELQFAPVYIGEGSDLGTSSTVLPGVRIGKGVQVGAGAVVTKNVPDYAVVAGSPAKILRYR